MEKTFILVGFRKISYTKDGSSKSFYKCTVVDSDSNILVCNIFNLSDDKAMLISDYLMKDCTDICYLVYDEKTMSYRIKISL